MEEAGRSILGEVNVPGQEVAAEASVAGLVGENHPESEGPGRLGGKACHRSNPWAGHWQLVAGVDHHQAAAYWRWQDRRRSLGSSDQSIPEEDEASFPASSQEEELVRHSETAEKHQ